MARLPWISRGHHDEVIAAKDALIRALEAQNAVLAERLAEPIKVHVEMPKDLVLLQPAVMRRRGQQDQAPKVPKGEPDWANINENDPKQMAKLAADELGTRVSPYVLKLTVDRLKKHIRDARTQQIAEGLKTANVGTIETDRQAYIPPAVRELIEEAEKV